MLANGRNVAPEWLEAELNHSPLIAQSYVYSDDGETLSVLLATTADDADIDAQIQRINDGLPAYARVREWHRLAVPFSPEQRTLTANGRLRRRQIEQQLPALLSQKASPPPSGSKHRFIFPESNPC